VWSHAYPCIPCLQLSADARNLLCFQTEPPPPVSCCLCVAGCSYPLTFCPSGAGTYTGSLELVLNSTGEKLAYSLAGKASEPLAEGHVLVECQVRAWMCVVFLGVLS
jgi:hypothetical protein